MIDLPAHAQHLRRIASDASKELNEIRKAAHQLRTNGAKETELERLKVLECCWQTLAIQASGGALQIEAMK